MVEKYKPKSICTQLRTKHASLPITSQYSRQDSSFPQLDFASRCYRAHDRRSSQTKLKIFLLFFPNFSLWMAHIHLHYICKRLNTAVAKGSWHTLSHNNEGKIICRSQKLSRMKPLLISHVLWPLWLKAVKTELTNPIPHHLEGQGGGYDLVTQWKMTNRHKQQSVPPTGALILASFQNYPESVNTREKKINSTTFLPSLFVCQIQFIFRFLFCSWQYWSIGSNSMLSLQEQSLEAVIIIFVVIFI